MPRRESSRAITDSRKSTILSQSSRPCERPRPRLSPSVSE